MKFQVAAATISTVGLSAFADDTKTTELATAELPQRKKIADHVVLKNFAPVEAAIETVLKSTGGTSLSFDKQAGQLFSSTNKEEVRENSSFDIGILGFNAKSRPQPNHRQLEDLFGGYDPSEEPFRASVAASCFLIDSLGSFAAFSAFEDLDENDDDPDALYDALDAFEELSNVEICSSCGSYDVTNTAAYNVELNCPGLLSLLPVDEIEEHAGSIADGFKMFCEDGYFCPSCEPLCSSCSFDVDNFDMSLQNCLLTKKLRIYMETFYPGKYDPRVSAASSMSPASMFVAVALAGASMVM